MTRSTGPPRLSDKNSLRTTTSFHECWNNLWFRIASCVTLLLLMSRPINAQSMLELPSPATMMPMDSPDHELELFALIHTEDHPAFGLWPLGIGDINDDGFDDLAVGTGADTTFIFLGGSPFDHQPDLALLGGASGITAGDFNGDGKTDIATAMYRNGADPDNKRRGNIRVYLHTGTWPAYNSVPDRTVVGDYDNATYGYSRGHWHSGVFSADLNGDGADELLFTAYNLDSVAHGRIHMIPGGENVLTAPVKFTFSSGPRHGSQYTRYGEQYMTGDLNGDGFEDLCIHGSWPDDENNRMVYFMDTWLGHPLLDVFDQPDIVTESTTDWYIHRERSNISDVNGDGYDDIVNGWNTLFAGVKIFKGHQAISRIVPNDSIPNQRPLVNVAPVIVCPVGDMSGDGRPDLIIGWATPLIPTGVVYYVYPAGPISNWKVATGYIGLLSDVQWIGEGAFPAGDLNGDGYDEMVVRGGSVTGQYGIADRIMIYSGSPRLTAVKETPAEILPGSIDIYPQPAQVGAALSVRIQSDRPGSAHLKLTDLLGRTLRSRDIQVDTETGTIELRTTGMSQGTYILSIEQPGGIRLARTIVLF